jgi:hypothetical protein
MFKKRFSQGSELGHFLSDGGRYLGYDISAELLSLGDSRLDAMGRSGIDVKGVSLTMPGCEAFDAGGICGRRRIAFDLILTE